MPMWTVCTVSPTGSPETTSWRGSSPRTRSSGRSNGWPRSAARRSSPPGCTPSRATRTRRSARRWASRRGHPRRNCRERGPGCGKRSRTSRENGPHDGRAVRAVVAGGRTGVPSPSGDAARSDVAGHRGAACRPPAAGSDLAPGAPLGRGHRGGAGAGRRHRALERDATHGGAASAFDHGLPRRGGAVPDAHRGPAHGFPLRGAHGAARRTVRAAGPRSARHDAPDARLSGGAGSSTEGSARRPRGGAGSDRPAPPGRRPGRCTADQPGTGTAQRAAAAPDGESRRPRPGPHARSTVMQMQLVVAAVMAIQQPVPPLPPLPGRFPILVAPQLDALTVAFDGLQDLEGLAALEGLQGLEGLEGLEGLAVLDVLDPVSPPSVQDGQDPTDSLWRAARQAFNRGDYTSAANLYGDLMRRYPTAARAGDALYWAAFALYKNDNLDRARSLLVTQERQYPKAATLRDATALFARIQTALAKQGDEDALRWLRDHAQPAESTRAGSCPSEDDEDDMRVAALNGLLQMDASNAVPILKKVLARRDACSAGLRRKAVFLVSQKHSSETEDILLDAAQHDPDLEVREQALFALSQQHSPRAGQILRSYAENANAPSEAREKAIFWLGQQHSGENAAFLRGLYGKLTDEELKEKVIFSLSQMHDADNNRWLMEIALNERESIEMRKKALFWAGQTGGDLTQLSGLYDRMQNREMKEQLIFVYSQRHEAAAVDRLIQIAKTEQDKELRKKAIFWLGQSHDPRAAQVLLEIINQ